MRDSIARGTLAGLAGAVVMNLIMYLIVFLGVNTLQPWQIAADVFLTWEQVNTPLGMIIGLIGSLALSIASALLTVFVLEWTGYDFAILKGIITTNSFGFVTMGLFMPLLKITPQIQAEPVTNLLGFVNLTIMGTITSLITKHFNGKREGHKKKVRYVILREPAMKKVEKKPWLRKLLRLK